MRPASAIATTDIVGTCAPLIAPKLGQQERACQGMTVFGAKEMGSLLDVAPHPTSAPRSWLAHFAGEYPAALSHLTARGNDQQTIIHDETDRTDFLTRLGQEIL